MNALKTSMEQNYHSNPKTRNMMLRKRKRKRRRNNNNNVEERFH